jgi:hypothetical protein
VALNKNKNNQIYLTDLSLKGMGLTTFCLMAGLMKFARKDSAGSQIMMRGRILAQVLYNILLFDLMNFARKDRAGSQIMMRGRILAQVLYNILLFDLMNFARKDSAGSQIMMRGRILVHNVQV